MCTLTSRCRCVVYVPLALCAQELRIEYLAQWPTKLLGTTQISECDQCVYYDGYSPSWPALHLSDKAGSVSRLRL